MDDFLSFNVTLGILALSVAGIIWSAWLERRPREFGRVRLFPTTPALLLCGIIAIIMIVHLRSFYGAAPQRPL
ncbi:MAG TPA: hypothetical protein PKA57_14385 [Parvibaculum sp.]|uniref:hypothetical protein n=1 Tax=Parvibaculum sp. TaxID=2024848 RepID=UPI002B6DA3C9|nr:hypothetical protein [Parvibaculum sp.]HMM15811.1 hypothetical protein [Parvibaculum sp.]